MSQESFQLVDRVQIGRRKFVVSTVLIKEFRPDDYETMVFAEHADGIDFKHLYCHKYTNESDARYGHREVRDNLATYLNLKKI